MAKKEKVGSAAAGDDTGRRPGNRVAPPSPLTNQTSDVEAKAAASAAAASPAQMENAMVQQILERQAVFGF
jgi:hypothetical protein